MNLTKKKKKKKKKKKYGMEEMTANKGLGENGKISRVCVRLLDGSSIYIFD